MKPDMSRQPTEVELPAIDADWLHDLQVLLQAVLKELYPRNAVGEEVRHRVRKLLKEMGTR